MFDIKLQIACMIVIFYIDFMYIKDTLHYSCNKYFDAVLYIVPWAIIFDGVSYLTVNHLDVVPEIVNVIIHLAFFIWMISVLTVSALYMFDKISGFKEHKHAKIIMMIPGILAVILTICGIGNLQFIEGVHTNYSTGFPVYVCFAAVYLYYGIILFIILIKKKYLPKHKRIGAISFITLVGILLIIQIIFPEFLVTSIATTMLVLGIYIEFENPSIRKMEIQNQKIVDSFATLVESRDRSTGGHIKRTKQYVQLLLKRMVHDPKYIDVMTVDYIDNVTEAAPLHDIGKISTPDQILQKPGKLTDEEYAIMKQHAAKGGEIIQETFTEMKSPEAKQIAYEVARFHHEKYDGRGYPDGLVGEQIPLHARVMAIADVFDAVSQKRCYREAMPLEQCFEIIEKGAGSDFDPHLVKLFLEDREIVEELCVINREL